MIQINAHQAAVNLIKVLVPLHQPLLIVISKMPSNGLALVALNVQKTTLVQVTSVQRQTQQMSYLLGYVLYATAVFQLLSVPF